ncbi:DUF3086 domain-containing protein [Baaleninema sp.]|uniref:DUF3086 domain-containing protein n=1 Tax=Baaleninema sp. TaxID=3101197 RepID=UPI003D05CF1B
MNPEENQTPESPAIPDPFDDDPIEPSDTETNSPAIEPTSSSVSASVESDENADENAVEEPPAATEIDLEASSDEAAVEAEPVEPESVEPESVEPEPVAGEAIEATIEPEREPESQPEDAEPPSEETAAAANPVVNLEPTPIAPDRDTVAAEVDRLEQRAEELRRDIAALEASRAELLNSQAQLQADLGRLIQEGLSELEKRKQQLKISIEKLERRQERIRQEMRSTFAGASQDLAIRLQGFKEYLVGSLQDLSVAAEQLELAPPEPAAAPPPPQPKREPAEPAAASPQFSDRGFQEQRRAIRRLLEQYRNNPDYYGPPWQLRRTFEPVHAERVSNWFFTQGGRGALKSTNSRLQNILIASAIISILHVLYGKRLRTLVLANAPERLGEWRRGLQDCLGITRTDFGPDRGVALFEAPEPLAQRADRLARSGLMPLVIIDESESQLNLSLLQFPLWLAFAPDPDSAFAREW